MPIVSCSLRLSPLCKKDYEISDRECRRHLKENQAIYCLYCSRQLKSSGRKNPNKKYDFDDNYFKEINTPHKAYLLGWLASDGHIGKFGATISIKDIDINILPILKGNEFKCLPTCYKKNDMFGFTISSKNISEDLCRHLSINPGKKSSSVRFPKDLNNLEEYFVRGYFEGDGSIQNTESLKYPRASISSNSIEMLKSIKNYIGIPSSISNNNLEYSGANALDFLYKIYKNKDLLYLERKKSLYLDLCTWQPSLGGRRFNFEGAQATKTDKNAFFPTKNRASDSGYDLTIIKLINKFENGIELYDSCIKIKPPFGYYFDLIPRSSFYKTGYIMSNSIGVIDRSYCGTVMVAVKKIDKNSPNLVLPGRYFQLVPRKIEHFEFDFLTEEEWNKLPSTERGENGFGSTGI